MYQGQNMSILSQVINEIAAAGATSAGAVAGVREPIGVKRKLVLRKYHKLVNSTNKKKIAEDAGAPEFNSMDVISKLKSAEKANVADRDTVIFGLEDEAGNVIKVVVAKEQAKEFERALAAAMEDCQSGSSEKEIAEVLFDMRNKFAIVDVIWPPVAEDEEEAAEPELEGEPGEEATGEAGETDAEGLPDELGGELGGEDLGAESDQEAATSALTQVIDMLRADAAARKAEADAKKAEAESKTAEYAARAAEAKVKAEEEVLDMEDFYDKQKDEDKEAKRLAKLAKYRHDLAQQAEDTLATEGAEASKVWQVHIPANVYDGKWYDYRNVRVHVLADSEKDAISIVNKNHSAVLKDLDKRKVRSGGAIKRYVFKGKGIEHNVFFKDNYHVVPSTLIRGKVLTADGSFQQYERTDEAKATDVYAQLKKHKIEIDYNADHEGWFFHDTTVQEDKGDGQIYETDNDAAYAAVEFYGLMEAAPESYLKEAVKEMKKTDSRTITAEEYFKFAQKHEQAQR